MRHSLPRLQGVGGVNPQPSMAPSWLQMPRTLLSSPSQCCFTLTVPSFNPIKPNPRPSQFTANTTGGHYSAHVHQPDGRWLHFNDANVSPVSLQQVLAERTYVLVYQKL